MKKKFKPRWRRVESGYSLVEVLIGVALISVVFLGTTAVYVSSKKMVAQMQDGTPDMDLLLATEHFSRKALLGNSAAISVVNPGEGVSFPSGAGNQISIRRDYDVNDVPLLTPGDFSDDTYLKYGIVGDRLRFKAEADSDGDVSEADQEVINGLQITSGYFQSGTTNPNRIFVTLSAASGEVGLKTNQTEVMLHGGSMNAE